MKKRSRHMIGIIGGTGKMGQWFHSFFTSHNIPVLLSGRKTDLTTQKLVEKSDIIILAVPIGSVEKTIKQILPILQPEQLLTDICSLKEITAKAMADAPSATLGMHPLFGPSVIQTEGQKIVFCHQKDNELVSWLQKVFESAGMEVITLTTNEHDQQMAYVQALTHAINLAFAKTLTASEIKTKLQTPLFTLQLLTMGRVFAQDAYLLSDLQLSNPYFLPLLKAFITNSEAILSLNEEKKQEKYIQTIEKTQKELGDFPMLATAKTNKILMNLTSQPIQNTQIKKINTNQKLRIGYLGPEGTNTYAAAKQVFPKHTRLPYESLDAVFQAVLRDEVDCIVVPAENSIHGTIRETLDMLSESELVVNGSFDLPIHHALLSKETSLTTITEIISHPQALAQCKEWLKKHLPNARRITANSTTISLADPKPQTGYLAAKSAATLYNLNILANEIEDTKNNTTRFYVIASGKYEFKGLNNTKTLLYVTIYNRVGILRDILTVFAKYNLNLTKIESRPSPQKMWDYCFYIEIDVKNDSKELKTTLTDLKSYCPIIRILGST